MTRLYLKTPSSARARAIFSPGKDGEAGDVCSIVDAAGCSQVEKGPLEARSSFQTEPNFAAPCEQIVAVIMRTGKTRVNSFFGGPIPSSRRVSKTAVAAWLSAGGWSWYIAKRSYSVRTAIGLAFARCTYLWSVSQFLENGALYLKTHQSRYR